MRVQREVEAFDRFRELSQQLLEINETICQHDPSRRHSRQGKNGGSHIRQEIAREVEQSNYSL